MRKPVAGLGSTAETLQNLSPWVWKLEGMADAAVVLEKDREGFSRFAARLAVTNLIRLDVLEGRMLWHIEWLVVRPLVGLRQRCLRKCTLSVGIKVRLILLFI
jgi:hypothetical protein